ncbi:hypothetical protein GGX14DRAFT_574671 [Mycena pura]|uniref:Uncharacterized protein n=1 Tax=Mycena pura TaxID=153505 RepID=A0AAD6UWZ5_9AGAR|nr:hypothetical protein GGX14DRAFT_574671 [Mycena pura]
MSCFRGSLTPVHAAECGAAVAAAAAPVALDAPKRVVTTYHSLELACRQCGLGHLGLDDPGAYIGFLLCLEFRRRSLHVDLPAASSLLVRIVLPAVEFERAFVECLLPPIFVDSSTPVLFLFFVDIGYQVMLPIWALWALTVPVNKRQGVQHPKQTAAEARIQRHVALKEQAKHNKFQGPVDAKPRDTYFHGEGGISDPNGTAADGHMTVDFFDENGTFLTTHHVYKDDSGYFKK